MFGKISFQNKIQKSNNNQSSLSNKNIENQFKKNNQYQNNPKKFAHTSSKNYNPNLNNVNKDIFASKKKKQHVSSVQGQKGKFNKNYNRQDESQKNSTKDQRKTKGIHKELKVQRNIQSKYQKNQKNKHPSVEQTLLGSKFRILNQLLYSNSSQFALQYFKDNQQDYQIYHDGYRFQADKWQSKPVNIIIKHFKRNYSHYKNKIICDLGCGEGFIQEELTKQNSTFQKNGEQIQIKNKKAFRSQNINSFDLVSLKPFIKVADIKNLPLKNQSVDVTVFCLSLMGKNYLQFIQQAYRVLKFTGQLIIAEVESRSDDWKTFIKMIQILGFQLINNGVSLSSSGMENNQISQPTENNYMKGQKIQENGGRYFRILHFTKAKYEAKQKQHGVKVKKQFINYQNKTYRRQQLSELSKMLLTQCIYKKR